MARPSGIPQKQPVPRAAVSNGNCCSPRLLVRVFEHHDDPALPPDID